MRKSDTTTMSKRARRLIVGMRASAGILIVGGALSLYVGTSASASTLGGTATIASTTNQPLSGGGSETQFTVDLPAQAACSGDTATDGYHVFSYLVPQGTAVTSVTFGSGGPSTGLGFADVNGYYGSANTAPTTGEIINIPSDFEWADLLGLGATAASLDGGTGVWEAGLACAPSTGATAGQVSDYWNTQVTFTASTSDPNGFVWTDVPGTGSTTSTTAATTSTTAGTTSTTAAGSTSTTTASTSGNGTTSTVAGATGASGSTGSSGSGSSGVSTDASTGATPVSSGSLAFTGALITRGIAIGLLCIGFGLIMLGLSVKVRREIAPGILLR
jgi:hypothetical protein